MEVDAPYEIVSIGSDEPSAGESGVVAADAAPDSSLEALEDISAPEDNSAPEDISAPSSRDEYSNAISGFLILKWRSPFTPSHVSCICQSRLCGIIIVILGVAGEHEALVG